MLEHPEAFAHAVEEFLDSLAPRPPSSREHPRPARPAARWLASRRLHQLDTAWRDPLAVQERTLRALVDRGRDTAWGREHGFAEIRGIADYQRRVPITTYLDIRLLVERAIGGEPNVLWPGRPAQYARRPERPRATSTSRSRGRRSGPTGEGGSTR